MRYDDPELQERLAGEYALGSLRGAARARFEALVGRDPRLRERVVDWQERLAPLAQETPDVTPPARVLAKLRRRIKPADAPVQWWNRLDFWRPFGALTTTLVIALAAYLGAQLAQAPAPLDPRYVAILADDHERPAVVVTAYNNPFRLIVEPLQPAAIPPGNVLRIFAVDRVSGARQRLAEFTPGVARRVALSDAEWQLVKGARSLIVSEEPPQVASAEPTGRILYSGPCINLKGPKPS
jgi:anti-sigma-K factor RskA